MKGNKLKGVTLAIVACAMLAIFLYTSPAISQQGALFSDQFNMNAYDWTPLGGIWQVVDGEYTQTVDPDSQENWSVGGHTLAWFDYIVEARVYSSDKGTNNPALPDTISLAGRWADNKNYYALEYSDMGTATGNVYFPRLTFYKRVNGMRVNLATWTKNQNSVVPYIGEGQPPVVLKMKFVGANVDIYIDGVLLGSVTDTSLYYGKIAVGQFNRQVSFDEIYVWDAVPPRLFTPSVTMNVGNAVIVDFTTDEYTSYRIDYGPTSSYGSYKVTTLRELKHSGSLAGLTPGTLYHYRVTVTDAAGNTTSSGDMTFTTDSSPDLTSPVISNVVYSQVYANKAIITFDTNEVGNSSVDYGLAPGAYKWSLSYEEIKTSHTLNLSRMEGQTKYYFKVKSRDVAGNLGISQEFCLQTLKDLKPRITRIVTGSSPTTNVAVYWQGVADTVNYYVYISPDNNWGTTPDATIPFTTPGSYSYQKFDLEANRNYFIKVIADDGLTTATSEARAFPPDTNPHGHYFDSPELCQNCHSTHDARGARLISEVNPDRLCITCHDGTQSKYDVLRGEFKGVDNNFHESIAGPYGTLEGKVVEAAYEPTSRHDLNIFLYSATGNNIDNIEVADSHLSCSSCHDPHGQDNYRNLRDNLRVTLNSTNAIDSQAYSVTGSTYEKPVYVKGAVEFCGGCHSDFNQGKDASRKARITTDQPGMSLSAASLNMFMHPVNVDAQYVTASAYHVPVPSGLPMEQGTANGKIICQTCHFTHGTRNNGEHIRRDGYSSTVLKRFDETVGCEDCHDKTEHPDP